MPGSRDLSPGTAARFARFSPTGPKTSLLSVPGAVGTDVAGFTPVGDVMGCVVHQIGDTETRTWSADRISQLAEILRQGYETALDRIEEEATAIGADGVLGIDFKVTSPDGLVQEFVALGTAVRAQAGPRPRRPFTTGLPGQDVAKLMQAGWVPVRVAVGICGRALTNLSQWSLRTDWIENVEIPILTELATAVRAEARAGFAREIGGFGADGGIVSDVKFDIWPVQDFAVAAMATVIGTAIAQFRDGPAAPAPTLKILPLKRTEEAP